MCWDATISINTFAIGTFSLMLVYANRKLSTPHFLYYILFTSMQLVEFFVWKYIHNKNVNHIMSIVAFLIIVALPLVGILAFLSPTNRYKQLLLLTYVALSFFYILSTFSHTDFSMKQSPDKHLSWSWMPDSILIMLCWYMFWIVPYVIEPKLYNLIINTVLFIVIYFNYRKYKTYGSIWCWISNLFSIYLMVQLMLPSACV